MIKTILVGRSGGVRKKQGIVNIHSSARRPCERPAMTGLHLLVGHNKITCYLP
jgi:hypothetical protein